MNEKERAEGLPRPDCMTHVWIWNCNIRNPPSISFAARVPNRLDQRRRESGRCCRSAWYTRHNNHRIQKATAIEREEALRKALEGYPPASLGSVAHDLGLGARSLRYEFPELASQVVERYRQFESLRKAERDRDQYLLGQSLLRELEVKELPLTQRNFQAVYGKPLMPASRIYQVYKSARAEQTGHPTR